MYKPSTLGANCMSPKPMAQMPVEVAVNNVGGIDQASVSFNSGVTVLVGRNATNRTSFLKALMAALGSENVSLKGDAESGSVELTLDDETYLRTLSRRSGTTVFDGDPYLDDGELADLFAFLLESNEARRAVERGDDLYDIIMRPVDTAEIDAEIDRLEAERDELEDEFEAIEELELRLPELEEERTRLEDKLETVQTELEEKRASLDELEAEAKASEVDSIFEALRETRQELEAVRTDLEDEERVVEALREDKAELEADLDGLADADDTALEDLEEDLSRHRQSVQVAESTISKLQSVIEFNESIVEGSESKVVDVLNRDQADGGSVTDSLVDGGEVVCWTCGSQVEREQIEGTIDVLQEAHREQIDRRNELREEIGELEAERKHIERAREERKRLIRQLDEVETEIDEGIARIEALESEATDTEAEVEALEEEVEAHDTDDRDKRVALHREVNELEFERDSLESELDEIEEEILAIEERLEKRDELEKRRIAIDDEIEELRSRIERLEAQAVEKFNDQMDRILDLLEFNNLDRVWIEQRETEVRDGRRKVTKPTFDLHVVRTTDSGSVYEDAVDHLSESEREVVGLVFALSGYLVHEVYERLPFMLLDSLEAIDADRIATLVEYLEKHAPNIVVALLPEDAAALNDSYHRITEI